MKQDKKGVVNFLIAMAVVLAVFAVGVLVTDKSISETVYESRGQITDEADFYCYSFGMKAVADPPVYESIPMPVWGFWPTLFLRVEYVMEFPPEEERKWAVIYIKPGTATDDSVALLNDIIESDPGIEIDKRLAPPLTEEQIVAYPDAVLDIIKQLDREQWESFYPGREINMPQAEQLARRAGIEVPT